MRTAYMAGDSFLPPETTGPVLGFLGAGAGAAALWLSQRLLGKAAFQTALNSGFSAFTKALQEEREMLLKQLREQSEHAAVERNNLRGEIINLTQVITGLKRILRENGINVPEDRKIPGEVIELNQDAPP